MPVLRSAQRGDLYIEVAVETPVKLSKRQKELLREFEGESKAGCQPEAEGFLARLKEFWNGGEPLKLAFRASADLQAHVTAPTDTLPTIFDFCAP